jgi:hypothetical protein
MRNLGRIDCDHKDRPLIGDLAEADTTSRVCCPLGPRGWNGRCVWLGPGLTVTVGLRLQSTESHVAVDSQAWLAHRCVRQSAPSMVAVMVMTTPKINPKPVFRDYRHTGQLRKTHQRPLQRDRLLPARRNPPNTGDIPPLRMIGIAPPHAATGGDVPPGRTIDRLRL